MTLRCIYKHMLLHKQSESNSTIHPPHIEVQALGGTVDLGTVSQKRTLEENSTSKGREAPGWFWRVLSPRQA